MEDGDVMKRRATIDTRPPFGSVKEAVTLFGEKVLAGKVYAPKHEQMESRSSHGGVNLKSELEETKRRLERSLEEGKTLANAIESVRKELEETRRDLQHLKSNNSLHYEVEPISNPEIEEIKFVENNAATLKKFVSFASPPSLVKEMDKQLEKGALCFRKEGEKKKPLGWLLSRKKSNT